MDGGSPNEVGVEATLDIENVIGLAPDARVLAYVGPGNLLTDTEALDIFRRIADDDAAQVVSTSWGDCEADLSPSYVSAERTVFQQMKAEGQSIVRRLGRLRLRGLLPVVERPHRVGRRRPGLAARGDECGRDLADRRRRDPHRGGLERLRRPGHRLRRPRHRRRRRRHLAELDDAELPGGPGGRLRPVVGSAVRRGLGLLSRDARRVGVGRPAESYIIFAGAQWHPVGGTSGAAPLWAATTGAHRSGVLHARARARTPGGR